MTQFEYGLLRGGRLGVAATHPLLPSHLHLIPMLSSISSFLPSALQIGNDKAQPLQESPTPLVQSPTKEDDAEDMTVDEHGVKKKKERTNEVSYIRPAYRLGFPSFSSAHGGEAPYLFSRVLHAILHAAVARSVGVCASSLPTPARSPLRPFTFTRLYPSMSAVCTT